MIIIIKKYQKSNSKISLQALKYKGSKTLPFLNCIAALICLWYFIF